MQQMARGGLHHVRRVRHHWLDASSPLPRASFQSRGAHVARVTVIPMDSVDTSSSELVEADVARQLAERASADPVQRQRVQDALLRVEDGADVSKAGLLDTLRTLKVLQEELGPQSSDLDVFWDILSSVHVDQVRCLLPAELAEVLSILAACDRRSPELVRALTQHCRRTARGFSAAEVASVMQSCGHMRFRSVRTIRRMSERIMHMVLNPALMPTVSTRHLRAIVGVHPRLNIETGTKMGKKKASAGGELDFWKVIAAALPARLDEMSPRDYSVILNAYAKMDFGFTTIHRNVARFFELAANRLIPRIMDDSLTLSQEVWTPRDIALVSNAYARIRAGPYVHPLLQAVAHRISPQMQDCNDQDVANILNAFPKLEVSNSAVFDAASPVIIEKVTAYGPQSLANVAHAYARQLVRHEATFERIAVMSMRVIDKFKPLELGNLAYAYGRVQIRHKGLLSSMQDEIIYRGTIGKSLQGVSSLYRFTLRSLEQLTQAFARLGVHDQRLFFVLFDMTRQRVNDFAEKTRRMTEDGSKAEQAPELLRAAKLAAWGEQPEVLDGHGLSVLMSAFAKSRSDFHTLVRWVPKQVLALKGQYSTWQLSTIFNACTRLGVIHPHMYKEMLGHAKLRLPQMSPKAVAMLIRAMARTKEYNRVVMRQAVKVVSARLKDLDVVDVGALFAGCAEMAYRDERFLRLLAAVVRTRMSELSGSQLASALTAYAQMRVQHPEWFDAVLFELFRRQHDLKEKDTTNTAYAMLLLAATDIHSSTAKKIAHFETEALPYPFDKHQGILYALLGITNESRRDLKYPSVFQLQIIELFLRLLAPGVYKDMRLDLKVLLAKSRRVSLTVDDYMQNSSKMHRRISWWFHRVGLHHRSEVFLGPFMLDIVIGSRVIVEIDGPSHFYRDTNSRTSGSIMKDMILRKMGFYVKHLPYQEWAQCGTDRRRLLYCASFWREVLAAQTAEARGDFSDVGHDAPQRLEELARLPPLMDVLDMVASAPIGFEQPAQTGSKESERQAQIPAFYEDGGDADVDMSRHGQGAGEVGNTEAGRSYDIDGERSGARPVEELLAAHQQAEERLVADRRRPSGGLSSRQRAQLDAKKRRHPSRDVELGDQDSSREHEETPSTAETSAAFHNEDLRKAQVRALKPRSKRKAPIHSGAPLFNNASDEDDTDMSDDEEEARRASNS